MPSFKQRIGAALAGFKTGGARPNRGPQFPRSSTRSYSGAVVDRLTEDFLAPLTTGDAELRTRLRILRGRARELERNEPYTRRFLSRLQDNIYDHHGITFASLAGAWAKDPKTGGPFYRIDKDDAAAIEIAYTEWRKNPFVTGDMSLAEGGRLALRCMARDGDDFVKPIINSSINEWGFALQLIEGDLCDDYKNEMVRDASGANGSQIRMGVEVDKLMCAKAYWMLKEYPGDQQWWNGEGYWSERHQADQFIHLFNRTRITQVRDTTWLCGIMRDLKMLNGYDEAAIVAARTGAAKMGFFTRGYAEPGDGYQGDQAGGGDKSMDSEPGLIEDLSQTPGLNFQGWDPAYPHDQYEPFIKTRLRRIGAGLDMSYYAIANDLTDVNFSSIRAGLLEDRERFKALQTWWIARFEAPIFLRWLETVLLNGSLRNPVTGIALPFSKIKKFSAHRFRPRRWPWVDPEKDANANKIAVDNRFKSRGQVIEETSEETFDDVINEQAAEQEKAEALGVELPPAADAMPPVVKQDGIDNLTSGDKKTQKAK